MSKVLSNTIFKFHRFQFDLLQPQPGSVTLPKQVFNKSYTDYPFVTLIRFISMMGIVWLHLNYYTGYKDERTFLNAVGHVGLYLSFIQIFKFSTLCFFMISGFLLGDKIHSANLILYYKKRVQSMLKPYLLVFLIFVLFYSFRVYILKRDLPELQNHSFLGILNVCLFDTPLWFIPNYLIALLVILIISRFFNPANLGIILFAITLLYTVLTVYTVKYQASHTTALFGYVFYLWLGQYIRFNLKLLEKIKTVKITTLAIILILIFGLSNLESYILYQNHLDHFNTLRIFNQLYSVAMFVFLIRVCSSAPEFGILNPRKETYGIYLYHSLFAWFVLPAALNYFTSHKILNLCAPDIYTYMLYRTLFFIVIYLTTTLLVKLVLKYNLGYLQK